MKLLKTFLKIIGSALIVCSILPCIVFAEEHPYGYNMPENTIEFSPRSESTTSVSGVSFKKSSGTVGYYSGITFKNSSSPYCTGSDATYNTDHSLYITSVKNQGYLGTCWIFGTVGALETAIWKQLGDQVDLSEMYMVYAVSNANYIDNPYSAYTGKDETFCAEDGGHEGIISAFWSRGTLGALIPEEKLKYYSYKSTVDSAQLSDIQELSEYALDYYPSQTIMLDANTQYSGNNYSALTGAKYIQETKDLIKAFGSAAIGYYDDDSCWVYKSGTAIYNHSEYVYDYGVGQYTSNHEVMLVGWDDNYDCGSTNKGAFLARNSWGASPYYGGGYFWMSYDTYFTDTMAVAQVVHASDLYDRVYETDSTYLSGYDCASFDKGEYGLMQRTYKTSDETESLTGIMIYNAYPGTEYKVYYTDSDTVGSDTAWKELKIKPEAAVSSNGTTGYVRAENTGYLTLKLSKPVNVSGNYTIAVVLRNSSSNFEVYGTDRSDVMYGSDVSSSLWYSRKEITADNIKNATRLDSYYPVNFTLKVFTKQKYSSASSAEIPCLYGKGEVFSGSTATFDVGTWTKSIPVYSSLTEGSPFQYISADVSEGKLYLTVSSSLRSALTNYTQRLYLGFRDTSGNEIRIPIIIGKSCDIQAGTVLRNGIVFINTDLSGNCYIAAAYNNTSGKMLSATALAQTCGSIAFDFRRWSSSDYCMKVFIMNSDLMPTAEPYYISSLKKTD